MSAPQKLSLPPKKRQRYVRDGPQCQIAKRHKFLANSRAHSRATHLEHWKKHHFDKMASHQEQWSTLRLKRETIPKTLKQNMKKSLYSWRRYYRASVQEKEKDACVFLLCCLRGSPIYRNQDVIYNILQMISKAPLKF